MPLSSPRKSSIAMALFTALLVAAEPLSAQQSGIGTAGLGSSYNSAEFQGSVPMAKQPSGVMNLSMHQAIELGLVNNLGLLLRREGVRTARGKRWLELSSLLPDLTSSASFHRLRESLAITGISFPGVPAAVGPFNYYDARVFLSQKIFDLEAIRRAQAAGHELEAAEFAEKDARELVVVAVGAAYLQTLAGTARVETVAAQLQTANATLQQAVELHQAGVTPGIDELRARVEALARTQQLIVAQNDLAKEKLSLLRLVGIPVGQEVLLTDKAPFEPLSAASLPDLLAQALRSRDDYRAAESLVKGAEASRGAARAERLPSLVLDADYGVTGLTLSTLEDTYHIVGSLKFPIFQGGKVHADVLRAEALLNQRRDELADLRGRIEYEIRTALLDLEAAASQVEVSSKSAQLADLALSQARERFAAGISDNLEVVQAQQAVAAAQEAVVSSQYQHNLAKLLLAKAVGVAGATGIGGK
jgi:outer membrane protein TolC